ncbi:MAG: hypothetical protein GF411_11310 [Candidatus Lokiarchaeota archaeon]|nr:hypothetical protein [Candidatus Lokiarchaeota archaeon]
MNARLLTLLVVTSVILAGTAYQNEHYGIPSPDLINSPEIAWRLIDSPDTAFGLFWVGTTAWIAEPNSLITFSIQQIHEDVQGRLTIGNVSLDANDTAIAKDFVLGVWGLESFLPGLIIETDETSIANLNSSAYASAERIPGNFMNGTMTSSYEIVEVSGKEYNCITFTYVQDEPTFGEPQETELSYDLTTGVLVYAKTSYSFGTPFVLEFELHSITTTNMLVVLGITSIAIITLVAFIALFKKK